MTEECIDTMTGRSAPAEVSSERVKDIFSQIAPRYERFNALSSFGAYRSWLNRLVEAAEVTPEDTVLDIAGGTGDVSFALAKHKHPKQIICTDLVPEMLEVARAHIEAGAGGDTPIELAVVDAQDIPYSDNSFDVVTMAYGLRNMPERTRALREMLRVLRPGGQLVCLDFSTPPSPFWRTLYQFYLEHMIPLWGALVTGQREGFVYLARSIKAFPDQQGVAHMMEAAGFEKVAWQNCMGGIACVHTARKPTRVD